jgi:methionyl-tRNA formyltransferase
MLVPAMRSPWHRIDQTAHSHARVSSEALARARLGGIGFHPSLPPRHRGMAAIECTIKTGDPIGRHGIYHLAERMDSGAIAARTGAVKKEPRASCGSARSADGLVPAR